MTLYELAPPAVEHGERFMEDAALLTVGSERLVQTVDVITPLVPDPADFGRIAASNAMSDVFVVGARPVAALAIACVPLGVGVKAFAEALRAARAHLLSEGCDLVGGHSLADDEPKLGFAITGAFTPTADVITSGARPGDVLLLTKALGVGLVTSACKRGSGSTLDMAAAVTSMTQTNSWVASVAESNLCTALHAATDVTGFGLVGHLAEMCRRSGVGAAVDVARLPVLEAARLAAEDGVRTSAHATNRAYVEEVFNVDLGGQPEVDVALLMDPQTSGGVVAAIDAEAVGDVIRLLGDLGTPSAVIGEIRATPGVVLA